MNIYPLSNPILQGIKAFESKNVKVFPCAYRGYYDNQGTSQLVFDPEARSNTEYNFVNLYGKYSNKESYVISFGDGILKCVIGGYYFELSGINKDDFLNDDIEKALIIKLIGIDLVSSEGTDGTRKTQVLQSYSIDATEYLDLKIGSNYLFTGLVLIDSDQLAEAAAGHFSASLIPFRKTETGGQEVNCEAYPIDKALSTSQGSAAIRGANARLATGENAIAVGDQTSANAKNAVVTGENSSADILATNAFVSGSNLKAVKPNQIVFGKYNTYVDKAGYIDNWASGGKEGYEIEVNNHKPFFVIGNGTENAKKDIFFITETGDVEASGEIKVKGNITAAGNTSGNNLTLGSAESDDSGSITVYGNNTDEIFVVDEDGNTNIKGTLAVAKKLTASAAVEITGPLTINGNTNLTSILNVIDQTTLNSGLEVTSGLTDLKDGLEVIGDALVSGKITTDSLESVGAATFGTTVGVLGATTLGGTLEVTGDTTIGTAAIPANLDVFGLATLAGGATIEGTVQVKGATTLISPLTVEDDVTIGKDTSAKELNVYGQTNITGNATIGGTAGISGSTTINDSLHVVGATTLEATLGVSGATTLGNTLNVAGTTTIGTKNTPAGLTVYGTAAVEKTLIVKENATFSSDVSIDGCLTKNLKVGTAAIPKTLTVTGDSKVQKLDVYGTLNVIGQTTLNNNVEINGNLATTGAFTAGATTISGTLTASGNITADGEIEAASFNATSDIRKKQAIVDYHCENSVLDLQVKEFEYINDPLHKKHIGVIAQDLQKICPEIVHEDKDGYLSIEENKLIYLLLQEVKELKAELKHVKGE